MNRPYGHVQHAKLEMPRPPLSPEGLPQVERLPSRSEPDPKFRTEASVHLDMVSQEAQASVAADSAHCRYIFRWGIQVWCGRENSQLALCWTQPQTDMGTHSFCQLFEHQLQLPHLVRQKPRIAGPEQVTRSLGIVVQAYLPAAPQPCFDRRQLDVRYNPPEQRRAAAAPLLQPPFEG